MPKKNYLQTISASPTPVNFGALNMVTPEQAKTNNTFGSAGATTTAPSPSPAKSAYITSVASKPDPLASYNPTSNPNYRLQTQGFGTGAPGTTGTGNGAPQTDPVSSYRSAFDEYIKSLKPSDAEAAANDNLAALTLQAKKDQEEALNRGETLGFATGEAARVNKNNSFAIDAASNAVDSYTRSRTATSDAQKARLDYEKSLLPSTDGFTLGKDQVRYDANGKQVATGPSTTDTTTSGTYTAGANPTVDAYIKGIQNGTYKPSDVPDKYQSLVAQGLGKSGPKTSEATQNVLSVIDSLLANPAVTQISGPIGQFTGGLLGGQGALAKNYYNQLQGMLSLANRQQLKGSGAISDFEFKVLSQAASSLGRNLSDADFVAELQKLKDKLSGNAPLPTTPIEGDVWKAPDGAQYEYQDGGWEQTSDSSSSFNNVGGDTNQASVQIPKSTLAYANNNPGNLRFAGQAGATEGKGGFAKFESPEAGFGALMNQIKLDAGKGLTLAQFISKYAPPSENDTALYIKQIAQATSSSPLTPIKSIPLQTLAAAMAKKESGTTIYG